MDRVRGLVSVVIPVYNSEKFLEETIQSVLAQSYSQFELLLIDDGSTDGSQEICRSYSGHPQVRIEYQPNAGVAAARNKGIRLSQGEFVAFLDSDDVWREDNLDLKVSKINSGEFGLVHSDAMIIDEASKETGETLRGKEGMLLNTILCWEGTSIPGPSSTLVRAATLDQMRDLFDLNLSTAADMDFFIRIATRHRIGRVDKITWKYRVHTNNMHSNVQGMHKDLMYLYRKCRENQVFENRKLRRRAYGAMYRILGASWMGDGKRLVMGIMLVMRSLLVYPEGLRIITSKASRKWTRKIHSL